MIYIKAIGHSPRPSQNEIWIGSIPCTIPSDGVTDTFIACVTGDTGLNSNLYTQYVTLKAYGTSFTTKSPYHVHFQASYTPSLISIFPTAGFGGQNVNLYGTHRISKIGDGQRVLGDITKLAIGYDLCNRLDVVQSGISSNSPDYLLCQKSSQQEAGKYNISELVLPGYADHSIYMRRSSFDPKQNFQFVALPTITSVSPSSGNVAGQYLKISGNGFSPSIENNTVSVDGNNCKVTYSTNEEIGCIVAPRDPSLTSKQLTNSTSQQNGYFSGAGLQYARYTVTTPINNIKDFATTVRSSNKTALGNPQQVGFRADLREGNVYGQNYGQTWKGYFTAPVDGNYTFRGIADDHFAMYISQKYGSTQLPSNPLIYSNRYQYMNSFYVSDYLTAEGNISLVAGKSYYIEVYHINFGGPGYFDLQVQVPNVQKKATFQVHQIDYLTVNSTIQPQIVVFTITPGKSDVIGLNLTTRGSNFDINYTVQVNVSYGCDATSFVDALSKFQNFGPYSISVLRTIFDSSNATITTLVGAARIEYEVSIQKMRSLYHMKQKIQIKYFDGSVTVTSRQDHSPLVSGTFTLTIGGVSISVNNNTNIPYNVGSGDLQSGLRKSAIVGFGFVQVYQVSAWGPEYSSTWIIEYKGFNALVPNITANDALLSGGSSKATATARTRRNYSSNLIFDPIDYRFLNTYSNKINVQVKTNDIPAICNSSCSYSFDTYSEILELGRTGTQLTLSLSNPYNIFKLANVTVKVQDRPCTIDQSGNLTSFRCNLEANPDGSPILVAGSLTPEVSIKSYGIIGLKSGVSPLMIPLLANSLTINNAGNNGGVLIGLLGAGLALDKTKIEINICNKTATIKTISNVRVDFYLPSCNAVGNQTITVKVNGLTNSQLSFNYTAASSVAPTILSLNPPSTNPGVKGTVQINGQNFGNDSSVIKVFLSNSTGKIYELKILSINNTLIKAGLPGGEAGNFKVEVTSVTTGDSIAVSGANDFKYQFSITGISPTTGSFYGGTLLTITGSNFSPASQQTLVYIGDTLNWFCSIQSITSTQIKCRTPMISSSYTPGTPVNVYASTRLIIINICPSGACTFTYLAAVVSPSISTISVNAVDGSIITLNGSNLLDSNNFAQISLTDKNTGEVTVVPALNSSATVITFEITNNIISSNYIVKVRNSFGQSNGLSLDVKWNPGTSSWSNGGGATTGNIVSFTNGAGYPQQIDGLRYSISMNIGTLVYPVNIISCCSSNSITFQIPPAASRTAFNITFIGPVNSSPKTYLVLSTTPKANITSVTSDFNVSVGTVNITFTTTNNYTSSIVSIKLVSTLDSSHVVNVNNGTWNTTGTGVSANTTFSVRLNAGPYKLLVLSTPYGYIEMNQTVNVTLPTNVITTAQKVSFNGGLYTIQASRLSPVSYISVNGIKGAISSYTDYSVTYKVPPLVTTVTQNAFNLAQVSLLPTSQFTIYSDQVSSSSASASFDGLVNTFYSSPNTECYIGLDAGVGVQASISRISFFPSLNWANVAQVILYSSFQGSNDQLKWDTLVTVDQTVHTGWNIFASNNITPYRYIRFVHNSTSKCSLAEIKLYGILYSTMDVNLSSQLANVTYNDGFNTKTFVNQVLYTQNTTPIVTSVSPRYGDVAGGYLLTLYGINLDSGNPVILIDGVLCTGATSTITNITCTVGKRTKVPTVANNFTVVFGSSTAILQDTFLYVLKWSSPATWGVDSAPIDNDLVYVPLGTTLLVDVNTPVLNGIAVQGGTLAFSDELDLTVQTGFITLNGGRFIAGTKQHPHTHKLTFIMHGDYYDAQQPMFGNKGIGCLNCKFSMYGKPRINTWSTITTNITIESSQFTVKDNIDWQVGQQIVVASTSFQHTEAQRRTIVAVSGKTVTVDKPFLYKHVSTSQVYDSKYLVMQAQVGLLTRNIKMMGDQASLPKKYGSHLMLSGQSDKGFEAHVAYSQFTRCGQPQILGRYCIHFHMAGDIPTSFAKGNAVHDSFARVITIHGVHSLTVEENVGYRVSGHNFFVEDGIETHNIIRNNLAISSLAVTNMLQTDTSVASFWITNPTNDFYGNHAAGSDFYGIWYEIKPNPDGPSATMDVCPTGNPLGNVKNNVAHSNTRFGLRVFQLQPRMFPCNPLRNNSNANDPFSSNPSIKSTFSNFTVYKNLEDGVLAQQTGNVIFDNFIIAQNYHSGIEFYLANFTKEPPTINNSVIVGMSRTNAHSDLSNYTDKMSAVITGRSGLTKITNVDFFNYPNGSILFQTCRLCDDPLKYTNVGTEVIVNKLKFDQINGNILFMIKMKRDVIYDLDGSFSQLFDGTNRTSATIVYGFPHIATYNQNTCPKATSPSSWDNAVICGPTITIRRVLFSNIINHQLFVSSNQKAAQIPDASFVLDANASQAFYSSITSQGFIAMQPKVESPYTWAMPYITGKTYNIWWNYGIDFTHLSIYTTPIYAPQDKGIIFKFNYSQNRQLFQVGPMRGGARKLTSLDFITESPSVPDINTCRNGDYYHDNNSTSNKMLTVCISGKNRTQYEYTEINGIVCLNTCPPPAGTFFRQNFVRKWSNASQWPNNRVPQSGDNVTVNGNWSVILDIDPNPLNNLTIDGRLILDDTRDVNITSNFIFIRAGELVAGSQANPFLHKITIQLNGQKSSKNFAVDSLLTANKLFVVSGSLNLYGNPPGTVSTYLTKSALAGTSTIYVASSTDWQVGDTLVLSPSFSTYSQYQQVTIQSFNSDGSINLVAPLTYTHYGSSSLTVNNNYGKIDTRTRVGHVNRNIKIVPGSDAGWGYTVTVYGFRDGGVNGVVRIGNVQLKGVQFKDGGQLQTLNSPLVFMNVLGNTSSKIVASSFVNCKANCIYVKNSRNVTFDNNILYNAWVFGAQFSQIQLLKFTNNVIIGVYEKPTLPQGSQLVACIWVEQSIDAANDFVAIKENYCLGSSQDGFAFPHIKCSQLETNPFANNTVGSAQIGFILNSNDQTCQAFSYAKAYSCKIGQICGSMGVSTLIFSQFLMIDNGRSITLKFGDNEGKTNHSAYVYNSYIGAVSRPDCNECYGPTATDCVDNHGLRMLVPSHNGERMPKKFNSGFDVVCKQPVYDSKSFFYNVTFDNFRQNYSGVLASVCKSNFALRPHSSAWDQSGSVNLFTSKCTNCDTDSYLYAPAPNPNFFGWFGGCGDIMCTGFQNYLVQDFDGSFFNNQTGTIIANNSVIAANQGCTFSAPMNAHMCRRMDFGVLQYQSVAKDFNKRIMWPVTLKYDGSNYTTVTNGWREWQWLGLEPQNQRFGRFVSIVKLNQTYNMSFASQPPSEIQIQLQKRKPQGQPQDYVIVRIYYPIPNSIRVKLNNNVVDPILLTDYNSTTPGLQKSLNKSICGSNIYFYTNRTISFVVTSAKDCLLTVQVTQSVQLTTHFAGDASNFFNNDSILTNFINNLCALLNIRDTSRVKVVGVFSGSISITTTISPPTPGSNDTSTSSAANTAGQLVKNGGFSKLSNIGLGGLLGSSYIYNEPPAGTNYEIPQTDTGSYTAPSSSKKGLIGGIVVAGMGSIILSVFITVYFIRRRGKVSEQIFSHQDEQIQEKEVEKQQSNMMFNQSGVNHQTSDVKIKISKLNPTVLKIKEVQNNIEILDY